MRNDCPYIGLIETKMRIGTLGITKDPKLAQQVMQMYLNCLISKVV